MQKTKVFFARIEIDCEQPPTYRAMTRAIQSAVTGMDGDCKCRVKVSSTAIGLTTTDAERKEFAGHIAYARERYAAPSNDDLEIDDKPDLSVADNGVWVSAWVWASNGDVIDDK